ncbi:MAG: DNA polymerase III subunit chi [Burkholderiaceae bacterium]
MEQVTFHFNVADRVEHALRLLRKVQRSGARCQVVAFEDELQALDAVLWTRENGDFWPHSLDDDPEPVRRRSPLHLGANAVGHVQVLVNLGRDLMPEPDAAWERVVDVVGMDPSDRSRARERWRHYRGLGIEPESHDFAPR